MNIFKFPVHCEFGKTLTRKSKRIIQLMENAARQKIKISSACLKPTPQADARLVAQ
jgi:hypothetical protein